MTLPNAIDYLLIGVFIASSYGSLDGLLRSNSEWVGRDQRRMPNSLHLEARRYSVVLDRLLDAASASADVENPAVVAWHVASKLVWWSSGGVREQFLRACARLAHRGIDVNQYIGRYGTELALHCNMP